jgi:magnesium chelatase accessory protein
MTDPARAERSIAVDGVTWHVVVSGTGPAILLLHGTGASAHSWDPMWASMTGALAASHTVVAPDLPGHGRTSALTQPATLPAMSRAVAALCTALGITPVAIVGHSAGVAIALDMVATGLASPRAIIGFGAALVPPDRVYRDWFAPVIAPIATSPLVARIGAALGAQPALSDLVLGAASSTLPAAQRDAYRALFASPSHVAGALAMMAAWDLAALLDRLATASLPPTTLVHGTRDAFVPLAALRTTVASLPAVTIVPWEGAGHLLHEEQPEAAVRVVTEALMASDPRPVK